MNQVRTLSTLLVAAALAGCATVAGAESGSGRHVVVVADASVPHATAVAAQRAAGPGADLRVPRTETEQLSVTHWFAARGYDVIGVGLSRRVAIDPVAERYPHVRLELLDGVAGEPAHAPGR
jgi:ABC-type sugar transport system substrate-binding protein